MNRADIAAVVQGTIASLGHRGIVIRPEYEIRIVDAADAAANSVRTGRDAAAVKAIRDALAPLVKEERARLAAMEKRQTAVEEREDRIASVVTQLVAAVDPPQAVR